MTDFFAGDLLHGEEPQPPVGRQQKETEQRAKLAAGNGALVAEAALARRETVKAEQLPERKPEADAPAEPKVALEQARHAQETAVPAADKAEAKTTAAPAKRPEAEPAARKPEPAPEPAAPAVEPEPVTPSPEEVRSALLIETLAILAARPEVALVGKLIAAYGDAPKAELAGAAQAITAVFLRAPAKHRKAMRETIAAAIKADRKGPLAAMVAVRLGSAVAPHPAPPVPPAPPGDG